MTNAKITSETAEWRAVPGYEGIYEVSDDGRVRSITVRNRHQPHELSLAPWGGPRGGYMFCCLYRPGSKRMVTAHSLVMAAFVGPRPAGMQVNHIDGDKANNLLANLEYVTPAGNLAHAYKLGFKKPYVARGIHNSEARFNADEVAMIRASDESTRILAQRLGVSHGTVWKIRTNRTYVEGEQT